MNAEPHRFGPRDHAIYTNANPHQRTTFQVPQPTYRWQRATPALTPH
jgi:hypothetical protein